jgi:hypothetical protein
MCTFNILYDLKAAYRNISKKGCKQEQQQEIPEQASLVVFNTCLQGRPLTTWFLAPPTKKDTGCRAQRTMHRSIVVHFSLFAIGCVRHEVFHGGYTNCRMLSTKRWARIRVRYRSRCCMLAWVRLLSTFVKTCVKRYGSYLILDRSSVAAVDIVMIFIHPRRGE